MRILTFDDHRDNRGFVVNPFETLGDTGSVSNCHAFSINPGCSRGGHIHTERNEKVLLLSGSITVNSGSVETVLSAPAFFEVEPGESHAFHCRGCDPATVLCWSDSGPQGSVPQLSG